MVGVYFGFQVTVQFSSCVKSAGTVETEMVPSSLVSTQTGSPRVAVKRVLVFSSEEDCGSCSTQVGNSSRFIQVTLDGSALYEAVGTIAVKAVLCLLRRHWF